jgi:hypothetical protein
MMKPEERIRKKRKMTKKTKICLQSASFMEHGLDGFSWSRKCGPTRIRILSSDLTENVFDFITEPAGGFVLLFFFDCG